MKLEIGKVYESVQGTFTKVINLKAGFVYFNGWHLKKGVAEKKDDTNGISPINERGFLRALGVDPAENDKTVEAPKLSDAAQKLVDENNVDVATLVGTGKDGAVTVNDVKVAIKAREADVDAMVDFIVTEETVEELNEHLPDGAEALKVGDVVKLDKDHELLK